MEESGLFAVVVRADVHYRKPARYDDLLILRTTIASITPAKIEHQYELFRDDELLATANITLALIDNEGKVCRVPEWMQIEEADP
jgi:acyl-CoA thioester hydrolase